MRTTNSHLAVFLWTFRRKWKGFAVFIAATAVMIFALVHIYPEISQLQSKAIAEAFGGDIEISLTRDSEASGDYTLSWSKYGEADGYVVVESEADLPLSLTKGLDVSGVDLRLLATFLPSVGKISLHTFDATTTQMSRTGLDGKYGEENALVYFGVLAFRGEVSHASIEGASQTVNTRNIVAEGALDELTGASADQALRGKREAGHLFHQGVSLRGVVQRPDDLPDYLLPDSVRGGVLLRDGK